MKKIYLLSFIIINILIQQAISIGPNPTFEVNLDLPYIERWREVITANLSKFKSFVTEYNNHVKITPEQKQKFVKYGDYFPEYAKNIEAISQLSGIGLPELYTYNLMYDIEDLGCTSVVIRQPDNTIFHARNLDYIFTEQFSKLAIQINWKKNGKTIYRSESLIGFVSLITVSKIGQFSISINYRSNKDREKSMDALLNKHYVQAIYLTQKALEEANSYSEAVQILSTDFVSSPIYYIVSGLKENEGIIIERGREVKDKVYSLSNSNWYLVQTNTDQSEQIDNRQRETQKLLDQLGQNGATRENMVSKVLNQFPMKNELTISTSVYSAYEGDFISQNHHLNEDESSSNLLQFQKSNLTFLFLIIVLIFNL